MHQFARLIREALEECEGNVARLAAELGVSESTAKRWLNGKSRPRPVYEAGVRNLVESARLKRSAVAEQGELYHVPAISSVIGESLDKTLAKIREILHRKGRISSRNEALEEVGVILFAHLFRIRNGGDGIKSIGDNRANAAQALHKLVKDALFARNLDALFINGNRQYLRLGTDENAVALEIVDAFAPLISIQGDLANCEFDLLNDVFGRFIADSFIDEKELGQYLTPPEVVRFMAKLAASSLTKEELQTFAGPFGATSKLILDPSCGVGSFLTAVAREIAGRAVELDVARSKFAVSERILRNCCVGIDKSERMLKLAQLSFAMFGQQDPKLHLANALARTGHDGNLSKRLEEKAQLILTNPPFGATFRENDIVKYRIANSWSRRLRGRVDSELLFVERYIDWLAPGGDLLAIVPDSILTNKNIFKDLRSGISKEVCVQEVVSLPPVTFAAAGTTTKTSVLHFKKEPPSSKPHKTCFAVCSSIGYEVVTRGSQRSKRQIGKNELEDIANEILGTGDGRLFVREASGIEDTPRWDAQYHSSLSGALEGKLRETSDSPLRVRDVATLVNERINPLRFNTQTFQYVEISDIDQQSCVAIPKRVLTSAAPSRARKIAEFGDVLVSTVRPERRTVGVLLENDERVICTTGLAILRPFSISSLTLAILLKSEFVIEQMVRNNVGIAYPAIEEDILPDIVLPVAHNGLSNLNLEAEKVIAAEIKLSTLRREFVNETAAASASWLSVGV